MVAERNKTDQLKKFFIATFSYDERIIVSKKSIKEHGYGWAMKQIDEYVLQLSTSKESFYDISFGVTVAIIFVRKGIKVRTEAGFVISTEENLRLNKSDDSKYYIFE